MTESSEALICEKLDRLSALVALEAIEGKSQIDQIELLRRAGYQPKEIAQLIGTTSNTVSVSLSKLRNKGNGKKKAVKA